MYKIEFPPGSPSSPTGWSALPSNTKLSKISPRSPQRTIFPMSGSFSATSLSFFTFSQRMMTCWKQSFFAAPPGTTLTDRPTSSVALPSLNPVRVSYTLQPQSVVWSGDPRDGSGLRQTTHHHPSRHRRICLIYYSRFHPSGFRRTWGQGNCRDFRAYLWICFPQFQWRRRFCDKVSNSLHSKQRKAYRLSIVDDWRDFEEERSE